MSYQFSGRIMLMTLLAVLLSGPEVPAFGQRPYFATPPPGSGPTPMRPYGQSGGCSEEPAEFHRCALAKAKAFNPPRTPDGKPDFRVKAHDTPVPGSAKLSLSAAGGVLTNPPFGGREEDGIESNFPKQYQGSRE